MDVFFVITNTNYNIVSVPTRTEVRDIQSHRFATKSPKDKNVQDPIARINAGDFFYYAMKRLNIKRQLSLRVKI